jgi:hypothetical protein
MEDIGRFCQLIPFQLPWLPLDQRPFKRSRRYYAFVSVFP